MSSWGSLIKVPAAIRFLHDVKIDPDVNCSGAGTWNVVSNIN